MTIAKEYGREQAGRDEALVAVALEATVGESTRELARASGISHSTWDRWRSGNWRSLQGRSRSLLIEFLHRRGLVQRAPVALLPSERAHLLALAKEIVRILEGD